MGLACYLCGYLSVIADAVRCADIYIRSSQATFTPPIEGKTFLIGKEFYSDEFSRFFYTGKLAFRLSIRFVSRGGTTKSFFFKSHEVGFLWASVSFPCSIEGKYNYKVFYQ